MFVQFLLVDTPMAAQPAFSGDVYYDAEKSKRGKAWYKAKSTAKFKGNPHSLGLGKPEYLELRDCMIA